MQPSPRPLRVFFITTDDPLYARHFFEVFFREYPRDRIELCGLTVGVPFKEPRREIVRRFVGLYGPVGFARLMTRFARSKLEGVSLSRLAAEWRVPELPAASVNAPAYLERLASLRLDVIVSVAAPEIFRAELLGAARLGCVNIHSGALPAYRGVLPTFWQLLHGEPAATVTIHRMTTRIDEGDILATARLPLLPRDSLHRVITEGKRLGARLMIETLTRMGEGELTPIAPDEGKPGWFSFPTAKDARAFRRRGHSVF